MCGKWQHLSVSTGKWLLEWECVGGTSDCAKHIILREISTQEVIVLYGCVDPFRCKSV
uniref:Uncharacterized protein n=1 Tax=Arundo donax TaxID=35708 RepID=A0A0A9GTR7_ARUDO